MRRYLYVLMLLGLSLALVAGCGSGDDKKMTLDEVTPETTTLHPALAPDAPAEENAEETADTSEAPAPTAAPTTTPEAASERGDADKDDAPSSDSAVFMSFEITGKGEMDLVVQNNGEGDISTGRGFILEKQTDDGWETIELGLAFTQDLIVIGPDEEHEFKYQLPEDFTFESGTTYRVVKYVSNADGDELTLAAPFDVE